MIRRFLLIARKLLTDCIHKMKYLIDDDYRKLCERVDFTFVDIGASYYPHPEWALFYRCKNATLLCVDPNEQNLGYATHWKKACSIEARGIAISGGGGSRTLYVTRTDSGSSLLPIVLNRNVGQRLPGTEHIFPIREKEIQTVALADLLSEAKSSKSIVLKIDVQGLEYELIESLFNGSEIESRLIAIEVEVSAQAERLMSGAKAFWDVSSLLNRFGFEVARMHPISYLPRKGARSKTLLNEVDCLFVRRTDLLDLSKTRDRKIAQDVGYLYLGLGYREEYFNVKEQLQR